MRRTTFAIGLAAAVLLAAGHDAEVMLRLFKHSFRKIGPQAGCPSAKEKGQSETVPQHGLPC